MMTWRSVLLAVIICSLTSPAYADFKLTPGVEVRIEYNDNIDLDSDQEKDDFITTVSPNVKLNWDTRFIDLTLSGSIIMEKYLDYDENDRFGADGDGGLTASALFSLYRDNLFLRVSDTYSRVVIDEGGRSGEDNTSVNQTDENRFQFNPYLQLQPRKDTVVQLGYTYENLWYKNDKGDDADSHRYYGTLTHELSDRVTAILSGSYLQYRPEDPDKVVSGDGGSYEYDQKNLSLGLSFEATERLILKGSYGHAWFDYDVREDADSETWSAAFDYEISSSVKTGAEYSNNYVYSVEDGPSITERMSAYLAYDDRFSLKGSFFTATSTYEEIDREDESYGGSLSGELPFNDKTGLTGLFRYTNLDRSGLNAEEYDRYSTSFSIYYNIRLGRLAAGYTYTQNDADISTEDYTNNIVFASASLHF